MMHRPPQSGSELVTKDEMRAEFRAARAEFRLLIMVAIVAGPVVGNLATTDVVKAAAGFAVLVAGFAIKFLWIR